MEVFRLLAVVISLMTGQMEEHHHGSMQFPTLVACEAYLNANSDVLEQGLRDAFDYGDEYEIVITCNDGSEPAEDRRA